MTMASTLWSSCLLLKKQLVKVEDKFVTEYSQINSDNLCFLIVISLASRSFNYLKETLLQFISNYTHFIDSDYGLHFVVKLLSLKATICQSI